ncbi:hypothetical protein E3O55_14315 [Cryobacterium sp. MDB1-18-2]|uniref:hypothetical protein n=1 Tax=unclassified Cryobacterium TaxID=2649013 RepID=UPI00106C74A9|nr:MULTISPECIES: hypothetical protein [unclassified Cryobacterium]TFC25310.1 hypothetical protein E3O55_14315 [Cryobacterium sp. MDB1-18-2]TFC43504.1 hypothetical protein E3O50_06705 [Cryobacterium sp. MDB1-18-1]
MGVATPGDQPPARLGPRNDPPVRLPARRPLPVYAFDPMSTRLSGRFLTVDVPFERDLEPGPSGRLVQVVDYDAARDVWYRPVDLNDPAILAQGGLRPSESDPRTHQQVVYAVAMSVIERFERFGGQRFRWRGGRELRIVPHAFEGRNAFFDPTRRAVLFGYYKADERDPGSNLPGQVMFTCLSVDVVAHEVTHAIVHRIRKYFSEASNPDVFAWHEAFADLVALFHHFLFPDVVAEAVANSSTDLREGSALLDLALEFGESTGRGAALRSAIGSPRTPDAFLAATEPHARGACFVAAVFDAYLDTYLKQINDLRRLATGGTGVLPPGALPTDLVKRVTVEAIRNADRILGMVVRAFQYLPVVDVTFGDVVRGIVTADRALYPDDAMRLRTNLVEALRRRGIYPPSVSSLTEEALTWPGPADPALSLTRGAHSVDLAPLILEATQNLDLGGEASTTITGADADPEIEGPDKSDARPRVSTRARPAVPAVPAVPAAQSGALKPASATTANSATVVALIEWGRYHAYELGLDPDLPLELVGVHAVFVQASDLQPRPIVVAQFAQRHQELEDQSLPAGKRMAIRAGTTVIARVDGQVVHVVAKPLPLSNPDALTKPETFTGKPDAVRAFAESSAAIGAKRAKALQAWSDHVTSADALAAWTDQPSLLRMTFASLHAAEEVPMPKVVPHA